MKFEKALLWGSAILFVSAMFLPGIVDDRGTMAGLDILEGGWIATFDFMIAWWANVIGPLGFLATLGKLYKTGLILSATAFIVGLQSYIFTSYPKDESGSGEIIMVHYLGAGFYLWEISFLLICIYCFIQIRKQKRSLSTSAQ